MTCNIHIDNYRSIGNASPKFEQLNIVFAPNGCVKSNIYKAIYLLAGAANEIY